MSDSPIEPPVGEVQPAQLAEDPAQATESATPATAPTEAITSGATVTQDTPVADIVMSDAPDGEVDSPVAAVQPTTSNVASPMPGRVGTPNRTNGALGAEPASSRANSVHPEQSYSMPAQAAVHGDPVRKYFNGNVTGVLLEGMKQIAKDRPSNPLQVLGEYLLKRAKDLEN